MPVKSEEQRVTSLMTWIRMAIPIIIAAIGWYVGQTVGGVYSRLDRNEAEVTKLGSEFIQHKAETQIQLQNILKDHDKLNNADSVTRHEFESIEMRIQRLENKQ